LKLLKEIHSYFSLPIGKGWGWAKISLFAICYLLTTTAFAQNLVPNPSFEDTVSCPTLADQVFNSSGWSNYSNQSPDYFNSCTSNSNIDVPNNWGGYQTASSGNAYCAVSSFFPNTPNEREIIGRDLSSTMAVGTKYYFSMKVNLSINTFTSSSYACNKLGVRFSTVPYNPSQPSPINNTAHIWTDSIITDTLNWTTIFGSFVADSAYNYIALGNFYDDANTDTTKIVNGTPSFIFAYYYVDDVCVSTDSSFCANYLYTGIDEQSLDETTFNIYPNPASNHIKINSFYQGSYIANIYDLSGKLIDEYKFKNSRNNIIDVSSFSNGVYLLRLIYKDGIQSKKIIINH